VLRRRSRQPRKLDLKLLAASFGIAVGLVLMGLGFRAGITGDEAIGLPDDIEEVDPVRGATQVPQQTRVFVDLPEGFEGTLTIDGVRLPTFSLSDLPTQVGPGREVVLPPGVVFEPGNVTLTFEPGPSQVIERFDTGEHRVTVVYWRTADGRDSARSFTWTFYAV
jgi:hypothetical protein